MSQWEPRITAAARRIEDLEKELAAEMERRDGLLYDARNAETIPYRTLAHWARLRGSTVAAIVAKVGAERTPG